MTTITATIAAWYPDMTAEEQTFGVEAYTEFTAGEGRAPRTVQELDAWSNSTAEFATYMTANPVPAPVPVASKPDTFTTPAVKPVFTVGMSVPQCRAAFKTWYGVDAPVSYSRVKIQYAVEFNKTPGGSAFKTGVKAIAEAKAGYPMPKTWTADDIVRFIQGEKTAPATTVAKTALSAAYVAKVGAPVPVSYTCKQIAAVLDGSKTPRIGGGSHGKRADGLTGEACRKLLSDARKAGNVEAVGYSKLNADGLRAMVAKLGLANVAVAVAA